jgi:hypothetical protein
MAAVQLQRQGFLARHDPAPRSRYRGDNKPKILRSRWRFHSHFLTGVYRGLTGKSSRKRLPILGFGDYSREGNSAGQARQAT